MAERPVEPVVESSKAHWNELDGLRSLAFLSVFLFHVGPPPLAPGLPGGLYARLVGWGWAGVDLFFVLSAFLITTLLLRERDKHGDISFRLFFLRRALRIWPLYYLNYLLGFVLLPALGFMGLSLGSPEWVRTVELYAGPFATFLGNFRMLDSQLGPTVPLVFRAMWSVCVEEQFYVVWCLVLLVVKSPRVLTGALVTVGAGSLALRIWVQQGSSDFWPYYHNSLTHLDPIVVGALLGLRQARGKRPGLGHPIWALALWAILVTAFPPIGANHPSISWAFTLIAVAAGMTLLSVMNHPGARALFSHPFLVGYGRLTYGLYVFHVLSITLIHLGMLALNPWTSPMTLWLARLFGGLLLTVAMAKLSWELLEKRCNRQRHRLSRL